jgi:hypothetical protein
LGPGKAQAAGALAPLRDRAVDGLEGIPGKHTVVAEAFDLEEAAVGRKSDRAQRGEIAQALADAEVASVVDGGLGAERAALLMVLLDAGVLLVEVQGRGHVMGGMRVRSRPGVCCAGPCARRSAAPARAGRDRGSRDHLCRGADAEARCDLAFRRALAYGQSLLRHYPLPLAKGAEAMSAAGSPNCAAHRLPEAGSPPR